MKAWSRFKEITRALLLQGTSPERIAACIALGVAIGICPIFGIPTPLLVVLALVFRLNQGLVQVVNYLVTGLQWLMVVPFIRFGEWLLSAEPLPFTPAEIRERLRADAGEFISQFAGAVGHAALGWVLVAIPLFLALFVIARAGTARLSNRTAL